ncbi:MAG: hypothetical protein QXO75_09180 [Nitrososphaerota archaeon]
MVTVSVLKPVQEKDEGAAKEGPLKEVFKTDRRRSTSIDEKSRTRNSPPGQACLAML